MFFSLRERPRRGSKNLWSAVPAVWGRPNCCRSTPAPGRRSSQNQSMRLEAISVRLCAHPSLSVGARVPLVVVQVGQCGGLSVALFLVPNAHVVGVGPGHQQQPEPSGCSNAHRPSSLSGASENLVGFPAAIGAIGSSKSGKLRCSKMSAGSARPIRRSALRASHCAAPASRPRLRSATAGYRWSGRRFHCACFVEAAAAHKKPQGPGRAPSAARRSGYERCWPHPPARALTAPPGYTHPCPERRPPPAGPRAAPGRKQQAVVICAFRAVAAPQFGQAGGGPHGDHVDHAPMALDP